jgi:hypothetical protein
MDVPFTYQDDVGDLSFDTAPGLTAELEAQSPVGNNVNNLDQPSPTKNIIKAWWERLYPQWNATNFLKKGFTAFITKLRGREDSAALAAGITTYERSTMFALGQAGDTTRVHGDRGHGYNVAIAVTFKKLHGSTLTALSTAKATVVEAFRALCPQALVVWVYIHPSVTKDFSAWIKKTFKATAGLGHDFSASKPRWAAPELATVRDLQRLLGEDLVQIKFQKHGDVMSVRPGWHHWVLNLQPCLKAAWDYFSAEELHLHVEIWRELISGAYGKASNSDYNNVLLMIEHAVTHAPLVDDEWLR